MSPRTNTSGWPGSVQSGCDDDAPGAIERRPGRFATALRRAATPARPRPTAPCASGSAPASPSRVSVTPCASTPVTVAPVNGVTPSRSSSAAAAWPTDRVVGRQDAVRRLDEQDRGRRRVDAAEVCRSVWLAISASAPASSTPVGPPPTTTNVSQRLHAVGSASRSAASKARSTRRRISVASSIVFSPGATALPLGVAEVVVPSRRSRRSASRTAPRRRSRTTSRCSEVEVDHLAEQHRRVALPARARAQRRRRCWPATGRRSPPDRAAAGRGGSCGGRSASPRPGALRSAWAAYSPPKPPPTITTRCVTTTAPRQRRARGRPSRAAAEERHEHERQSPSRATTAA